MEATWVHNSPHVVFWRRLLNERVDELVNSPDWLKRLRFAHDEVRWWRKNCGHIFEERGLNLYHLIAQAHGEVWDEEDEQKCAQAEEEKKAERPASSPWLRSRPLHNRRYSLHFQLRYSQSSC